MYYENKSTEAIQNIITKFAGRFFFDKNLTGAAWNCLEMISAELETRTGDEMAGRYDAQSALNQATHLLGHRQRTGAQR